MKDLFLAKSNGESLEDHTNRLLSLYDEFLSLYENKFCDKHKKLIKLAIIHHDLGKINSAFQIYIYNKAGKPLRDIFNLAPYKILKGREIPHGILSGAFVRVKELMQEGYDDTDIKALITAICNHHTRSVKCDEDLDTIKQIIENDLKGLALLYGYDFCKINPIDLHNLLIKEKSNKLISEEIWLNYAVIKGILNKMDYAASSYNDTSEYEPDDAREKTVSKFDSLRECQEYMLDKADKNVIMTASTGMGKTEAALIWAGRDKTFYTLPYKVSIDAIYRRIIEKQYYLDDRVVLLHSDALSRLLDYDDKLQEYNINSIKSHYNEIKNFSFPITVCTVDQLFLFSLRALGTELIAATLSYSKIIIDEIQAYEPKILAKILYGLYLIHKLNGKFLIMTATLPPFIREYLLQKNIPCEVSKPFFTKDIRHIVTLDGEEFDCDKIVNFAKDKKVLVICNTVSKSQEVFTILKKSTKNVNLLHSRFIYRDRKAKEEQILNKTSEKCIWISTQLVEASLDIDFDVLFTEMSTADSLLQRMGRCYRSRVYKDNSPNVFVYDTKNGISNKKHIVYDYELYIRSLNHLRDYVDRPFAEEQKQKYIETVYDTKEIEQTNYYEELTKELNKLSNIAYCYLDKETAQKAFREINSISVIPIKFIKEAEEIYNSLHSAQPNTKVFYDLKNQLKQFSLQINANTFSKKYKLTNKILDNYIICANDYDDDFGLIDYDMKNNFI